MPSDVEPPDFGPPDFRPMDFGNPAAVNDVNDCLYSCQNTFATCKASQPVSNDEGRVRACFGMKLHRSFLPMFYHLCQKHDYNLWRILKDLGIG